MATQIFTKLDGKISDFATAVGTAMKNRAPLTSPALTGTPTAPTADKGTNSTQIATTAFVQAAISEASGGTIATTFTALSEEIAAGTEITVPAYTVGANTLQVFIDGALAVPGVHYTEVGTAGETSTKITFSSALPAKTEFYATGISLSKVNTAVIGTTTRTETVLTTPIAAGAAVTVPAYFVGTCQINVFIDGIKCRRGDTFSEVGTSGAQSTSIKFNDAIPAGYDVEVVIS